MSLSFFCNNSSDIFKNFLLFFFIILTAPKAKDILGLYIASGVAIMLGLQVIMNVAVVTGSMPPTGVTLPFISYGGSSIWVFMYAMGMALNVSRSTRKRNAISK